MSLRRNLDIVINTKGDTKKIQQLADIEKNILENVTKTNEKHQENTDMIKEQVKFTKKLKGQGKNLFFGGSTAPQTSGGKEEGGGGSAQGVLGVLGSQLIAQGNTTNVLEKMGIFNKQKAKSDMRTSQKDMLQEADIGKAIIGALKLNRDVLEKLNKNLQPQSIPLNVIKSDPMADAMAKNKADAQKEEERIAIMAKEKMEFDEKIGKQTENIMNNISKGLFQNANKLDKTMHYIGESFKLPFKSIDFFIDGVKGGTKKIVNAKKRVDDFFGGIYQNARQVTVAKMSQATGNFGREKFEGARKFKANVSGALDETRSGKALKFVGKRAGGFVKGRALGAFGIRGVVRKGIGKTLRLGADSAKDYFNNLREGFEENAEAVEDFKSRFKKMSLVATGALAFIVASSPGLQGQLKLMQLNFKLIAMELGEKLQPAFEKIGEIVQSVTDWFFGLSDGQQQMIVIVLAVIAGLGALAGVFAVIGSVVGAITTVFSILSVVIGSITLPILLIIGAIVLVILAFKNWDKITAWFMGRFGKQIEAIKNFAGKIFDYFREPIDRVKGIFVGLIEDIKGLLSGGKILDIAKKLLGTALSAFRPLIQGFSDLFPDNEMAKNILNFIDGLPSYAIGTDFVPEDMIAQVHRGEMIIPAKQAERIRSGNNGAGFSGVGNITVAPTINLTVTGTGNDEAIARRASDMAVRELERLISRI